MINEKILDKTNDRFVLFPIQYDDIWELYKKALSSFWTAEEIDFTKDINDWENKLNDNERFFIKNVLAFFAASDGIVNENLAMKFYNEVQIPEMRNLYATQIQMEAIHSECVTGETLILTEKGHIPIKELVGETIKIYNGFFYTEVLIEYTGKKNIFKVDLSNGVSINCSENHNWIIAGKDTYTTDLKKGDYIIKHYSIQRPPLIENNNLQWKNPRSHAYLSISNSDIISNLKAFFNFNIFNLYDKPRYKVPVNYSFEIQKEWLFGILDSEAALLEENNNLNYTLKIFSKNLKLLQDIQLLLFLFDICPILNNYTLTLTNNDIYSLKIKGIDHPKIAKVENCNLWGNFPQLIYINSVENLKILEDTYCFHEKENGTGIFNGILTKQCYSLMIDTYIKNKDEKMKLFKSLESNPIVSKKAQWALKWINDSNHFAERLIAFCAVEGIFFSGSFCSIFWLKSRNLMPALTLSNQFISRDESLHCETCVVIYSKLKNKLSTEKIHAIFKEAYEIEKEFITESLPVNLIGMNAKLMQQYIQFIVDYWLVKLNYPKLFKAKNPFEFMNYISLENKTNFFEKRVSEYSKVIQNNTKFNMEEDF